KAPGFAELLVGIVSARLGPVVVGAEVQVLVGVGVEGVVHGHRLYVGIHSLNGGVNVLLNGLTLGRGVDAVVLNIALRQVDVDAGGHHHIVHRGRAVQLFSGPSHRLNIAVGQVGVEVVVLVSRVAYDHKAANGFRSGAGLVLGSRGGALLRRLGGDLAGLAGHIRPCARRRLRSHSTGCAHSAAVRVGRI